MLSLTVEHIDSSPYGGVYLSPPLDNNWRRWVRRLCYMSWGFFALFSIILRTVSSWCGCQYGWLFVLFVFKKKSNFYSTVAHGDEKGDELWPSYHFTLGKPCFLSRRSVLKVWVSSSCRPVTMSWNILFFSCFSFSSGRFLCVYRERIMALR